MFFWLHPLAQFSEGVKLKKKCFGGDGPDQASPGQKGVTEKPEGPGTSLCGLGGLRPTAEKHGLQTKQRMNQVEILKVAWKQTIK